jgi:hypothetical protein
MTTGDLGDRPRQIDVVRFEKCDATSEPHGEASVTERQEDTRLGHPGMGVMAEAKALASAIEPMS